MRTTDAPTGLAHPIQTQRLVLRQPVMADGERVTAILDNFAVSGNLARVPYPYGLAQARTWLASCKGLDPAREAVFALDWAHHGMIGSVGVHRDDEDRPVLGYYLGQPYWGRGLMSEAVRAVVRRFFTQTNENALFSGVFSFNAASLAIQTKLGFTQIGRSMIHCLARGHAVGHIDTQLTRASWLERQQP